MADLPCSQYQHAVSPIQYMRLAHLARDSLLQLTVRLHKLATRFTISVPILFSILLHHQMGADNEATTDTTSAA